MAHKRLSHAEVFDFPNEKNLRYSSGRCCIGHILNTARRGPHHLCSQPHDGKSLEAFATLCCMSDSRIVPSLQA
jgi:hypothetical protein